MKYLVQARHTIDYSDDWIEKVGEFETEAEAIAAAQAYVFPEYKAYDSNPRWVEVVVMGWQDAHQLPDYYYS